MRRIVVYFLPPANEYDNEINFNQKNLPLCGLTQKTPIGVGAILRDVCDWLFDITTGT